MEMLNRSERCTSPELKVKANLLDSHFPPNLNGFFYNLRVSDLN